jgi:hypothetical protein
MVSCKARTEAVRTQRTAVKDSDEAYDEGPDVDEGKGESDVVYSWEASNLLKDVKAMPFNNHFYRVD